MHSTTWEQIRVGDQVVHRGRSRRVDDLCPRPDGTVDVWLDLGDARRGVRHRSGRWGCVWVVDARESTSLRLAALG